MLRLCGELGVLVPLSHWTSFHMGDGPPQLLICSPCSHGGVCLPDAKITNQFKILFEKVKPVVFSVMETKQLVDLTFILFNQWF